MGGARSWNAWVGLGQAIGSRMVLIVPACVAAGVLFSQVFGPIESIVPVLFAIMTFQGALSNTFVPRAGKPARGGPPIWFGMKEPVRSWRPKIAGFSRITGRKNNSSQKRRLLTVARDGSRQDKLQKYNKRKLL